MVILQTDPHHVDSVLESGRVNGSMVIDGSDVGKVPFEESKQHD